MKRKVCTIIGAGEGLGRALAARFSSEGLDLALISRTEEGSNAAAEAARSSGVEVRFYSADAQAPETIEGALTRACDEFGTPDVLIYNVRDAFTRCEPLEMSYADLEAVFRLEVVSAFAAARAVLPASQALPRAWVGGCNAGRAQSSGSVLLSSGSIQSSGRKTGSLR